jgi:tagatose-6-phosphate ketose/aldose isomerase
LFRFGFISASIALFCRDSIGCLLPSAPQRRRILSNSRGPENGTGQSTNATVTRGQREAARLLSRSKEEQQELGYFHTLHEILQQPATWLRTGRQLASICGDLRETIDGAKLLVLTGSGSSEFAGECLRLTLQNELAIPTQTIAGGDLLTHGASVIAPQRPALMLSLARSGDSPESVAAVAAMLEAEPAIRHLVITCNTAGKLATTYADDPRVRVVVLADETNDRSLVMTSSFTNMVLAGRSLGMLGTPDAFEALAAKLSGKAKELLDEHFDALAELARSDFSRVVFLADGAAVGAACECALKMTEMTAGCVVATHETYLGLRHGPMSAVHPDTLIVCFMASDPLVRAYEVDLVRELNAKGLGTAKLLFGEAIPADLAQSGDVRIECAGLSEIGDENLPILDVVIGQLLALFRCLKEGLKPDSPSCDGVISRVVGEFTLHGGAAQALPFPARE